MPVLKNKAVEIAEIAGGYKALDTVILDLRKVSNFCDFFVILTGTSQTHIRSIADGINKEMHKYRLQNYHLEGYRESRWVVLDYSRVVVHIFDEETRNFYNLERLWADAPRLNIQKKNLRKRK